MPNSTKPNVKCPKITKMSNATKPNVKCPKITKISKATKPDIKCPNIITAAITTTSPSNTSADSQSSRAHKEPSEMLLRWLNETRRGEMVFTEWMIASQSQQNGKHE